MHYVVAVHYIHALPKENICINKNLTGDENRNKKQLKSCFYRTENIELNCHEKVKFAQT